MLMILRTVWGIWWPFDRFLASVGLISTGLQNGIW